MEVDGEKLCDSDMAHNNNNNAVAAKTKAQSSRSWVSIVGTGESEALDVDKYAIMHRVQIHARDLRILDPNLSYPSTILGRERAIVLNLEVRVCSFFVLICLLQTLVFVCFTVLCVCVWCSISRRLSLPKRLVLSLILFFLSLFKKLLGVN